MVTMWKSFPFLFVFLSSPSYSPYLPRNSSSSAKIGINTCFLCDNFKQPTMANYVFILLLLLGGDDVYLHKLYHRWCVGISRDDYRDRLRLLQVGLPVLETKKHILFGARNTFWESRKSNDEQIILRGGNLALI